MAGAPSPRLGILAGDMVIEYQGEVVRASVADCRERRLYDTLVGAGTYVFTLNQQLAVDATRQGQLLPVHLWSALQYDTLMELAPHLHPQHRPPAGCGKPRGKVHAYIAL